MKPRVRSVLVILGLLLVVSSQGVAAQGSADCTLDADQLRPLVTAYNQNVDQVPGLVRGQIAGQRIDVVITGTEGDRHFAVRTDSDGRVVEFDEGTVADPTLRVESDQDTACGILNGEDPVGALVSAYEDGRVSISGVGVFGSIAVEVGELAVSVLQWLGIL